jgi:hypothetical protein
MSCSSLHLFHYILFCINSNYLEHSITFLLLKKRKSQLLICVIILFPVVLVHTRIHSHDLLKKHDMRFAKYLKSQYDVTDRSRVGDHNTKMLGLAPGLQLMSF